jgi:hypothetical protein
MPGRRDSGVGDEASFEIQIILSKMRNSRCPIIREKDLLRSRISVEGTASRFFLELLTKRLSHFFGSDQEEIERFKVVFSYLDPETATLRGAENLLTERLIARRYVSSSLCSTHG